MDVKMAKREYDSNLFENSDDLLANQEAETDFEVIIYHKIFIDSIEDGEAVGRLVFNSPVNMNWFKHNFEDTYDVYLLDNEDYLKSEAVDFQLTTYEDARTFNFSLKVFARNKSLHIDLKKSVREDPSNEKVNELGNFESYDIPVFYKYSDQKSHQSAVIEYNLKYGSVRETLDEREEKIDELSASRDHFRNATIVLAVLLFIAFLALLTITLSYCYR